MSEYIIELPDSGAADEFVAKMGVEDCRIYGYWLTGEIVRCRDCEHFATDELGDYCTMFDFEDVSKQKMLNGFCAWGERETINKTGDIVTHDSRAERTCERILYKPTGVLVCSECGAGMPKQLDKYCYLHYCPNCGCKVVGE